MDSAGRPEPRGVRFARIALLAVCIGDLVLGALILFTPRALFSIFNVSLPPELLWFQLIGLMLIPDAVYGWVGFREPHRYAANMLVSTVGRFATSGFLFFVSLIRDIPGILILLAFGEAVAGALGAYYLARSLPRREAGQ